MNRPGFDRITIATQRTVVDGDPLGTCELQGVVIDRYKLLEQIGEGGFGTVWMAEQREPVTRRVALKIIKLGMDTKQVIARFEAERQALAIMDHPNIAKVFDAGATETGRPYFVMELVKGVPITQYCDAQNLAPRDRLELYISVCQAVQHAHTKGIIHRDIKPSNVLVSRHDDKPVVKVIDFGIAKATAARLTEKTVFTEFRQMIGTPAYMSPEQAGLSDLDIDTRTDVYSLGVLLYELLTGTTPFDVKTLLSAGYAEIQRVIREVEPPTPSSRLSTMKDDLPSVAANRRTEPAHLMKLVRGDLDWIVMKCLEKDRARRYETASGMAADIQRYIAGEPVLAAPPSAGYKFRKFILRNKASVTAGAIVAVVLIAGIIGTTWGMIWALRERDRADNAAGEALVARGEAQARSKDLEKVVAFQSAQLSGVDVMQMGVQLRRDMLNGIRLAGERTRAPDTATEASVAAADGALAKVDLTGVARSAMEGSIFKPSIDAIREQFVDHPKIRADLLMSVSDTARRLGALDIAEGPGVEAVEIRTADLGPNDAKTLDARMYHALLLKDKGRLDESEREMKECIALALSTHGNNSEITMDLRANFAAVLAARAQFQDAADLYRLALPWYEEHAGRLDQQTLGSLASLASALSNLGRFEEAEPLFRESVQGFRTAYGKNNMRTLQALNNLAGFYRAKKDYGKAREVYEEALQAGRQALGEDHWLTLMIVDNIGGILFAQDHFDGAAEFARSALNGRQRVLGANHAATLRSCFNLARVLESKGKADEATTLYRRAAEGFRGAYGEFHSYTISARTALSGLLIARGRFQECSDLLLSESAQFDGHPEATKDRRQAVVRALSILYEKWDAAEPGKGYDAKAATWRAKLHASTSQPVSSQPVAGGK
ncbi:MAG TPA: serine/threonine-protein kinase [Phycisphaerae bacterium]|nr:serine/threonine-protein kinase [Phycisphaerae bacterium]